MNLLATIIILLVISYLLVLLAKKVKIPTVIALILGGLIIGFPFFRKIIIDPNVQFIFGLGDIALLCLMFLAGLESSWQVLYRERKDAAVIAVFASLVPFLFGFIVFLLMGFSLLVSSIVGICMSITSEATKARVLLGLKKLRTKIGSIMIGAGLIDDILGFSFFILVTYLLKVVYLKEDLLIAGAIISFFVGILVQKNIGRKNKTVKFTENFLLFGIVPFFFISMGLHFDLNSLFINLHLLAIIITIAILGKLLGTFLAKPFTDLSWKQLHLIGWGMNSRGAVELALALIAFRSALIPAEVYSGLVVMALTTTLIFPFVITQMIKKEPRLMD